MTRLSGLGNRGRGRAVSGGRMGPGRSDLPAPEPEHKPIATPTLCERIAEYKCKIENFSRRGESAPVTMQNELKELLRLEAEGGSLPTPKFDLMARIKDCQRRMRECKERGEVPPTHLAGELRVLLDLWQKQRGKK